MDGFRLYVSDGIHTAECLLISVQNRLDALEWRRLRPIRCKAKNANGQHQHASRISSSHKQFLFLHRLAGCYSSGRAIHTASLRYASEARELGRFVT